MEEVLNYEGLIYSIINKYPKRYDRDDLYQVGMLGLINFCILLYRRRGQ